MSEDERKKLTEEQTQDLAISFAIAVRGLMMIREGCDQPYQVAADALRMAYAESDPQSSSAPGG